MKDVEIGVQTFTYRKFDIPGIIRELKDTGITALEVYSSHLSPETPAGEVTEAQKMLSDAGMNICATGVYSLSSEKADEMRASLEFAAGLGADYVSIGFDPSDEKAKEMMCEIALEVGVLLGIHNHGPGDKFFAKAEAVLAACEGYDEVLGACVDTGHFLRVDQTAEHAIRLLGKRVHGVHLKDFVDAETEVVPGTGKLDYATALAALDECTNFDTAFVIEYEADAENPTPGMKETVRLFKEALEA